MQAAVWGPVGWTFLHTIAHGFPDAPLEFDMENGLAAGTTANNYKQFFVYVGSVLPCKYCRESYVQYVAEAPPRTESRSTLTKWLWGIHNRVNDKLGSKYKGADFHTVCAKYESFRAKCSDPTSLGCTIPDGKNTRKRARVVIQETGNTSSARSIVLLSVVALCISYVLLKTRNMKFITR